MDVLKRINKAVIAEEFSRPLNEGILSDRARAFLTLMKTIVNLSVDKLISLATGKEVGMAESRFKYGLLNERANPGEVNTIATGNNYRAVSITAGNKQWNMIVPKNNGQSEVGDSDVSASLLDILQKIKKARDNNNASALDSYRGLFYRTTREAYDALVKKEQERGGQVSAGQVGQRPAVGRLKSVLTPIVIKLAGTDGPAAGSMLQAMSDKEMHGALSAHVWDANSLTMCARMAWGMVSDMLDHPDKRRAAESILAQTALAFILLRYCYSKAQNMSQMADAQEAQADQQAEAEKKQIEAEKRQADKLKRQRDAEKATLDQEQQRQEMSREAQLHAAELAKKEAEIDHKHAQAEATAKRPI